MKKFVISVNRTHHLIGFPGGGTATDDHNDLSVLI